MMSATVDSKVRRTCLGLAERLRDERGPHGPWEGELSTSALSSATAVFALICVRRHRRSPLPFPSAELDRLIDRGRAWLAARNNDDGGWGDTVTSPSNLPTTVLCWAALAADAARDAARDEGQRLAVDRAEVYLRRRAGGLEPEVVSRAIRDLYGKDRTFSVPILTLCALAGRLGSGRQAWRHIPTLPFELAVFPRSWFKHLGLPVVSYALPALIAMGQTQHRHRPTRLAPLRWLRDRARRPTLGLLEAIQPASGGFLEAIPLTSFVTMSLATCGRGGPDHPVIDRALRFLAGAVRDDGSWPIDVNLTTWGTTLAVQALSSPGAPQVLSRPEKREVLDWLLGQQHRSVHPFTAADPGGWAWTDLPGGVPDADDTAGALLALAHLAPADPRVRAAAERAVTWLLDLQNRDGGMPTFCRGWGSLPFDRSADDITAHALRAWHAWSRGSSLPASLDRRLGRARVRALDFLRRRQRADGSWVPLWFGNQHAPDRANPTYGTSRVVLALAVVGAADAARGRGVEWLLGSQNGDGGWGGGAGVASSVEETALALEALAAIRRTTLSPEIEAAGRRAIDHLLARIEGGDLERPTPIGLYFADLWYAERLYPTLFSLAALGRWLGAER